MGSGIDVARVRAHTPGCARVVHFNNAGAALPPRQVTEAVIAHIEREAHMGGYEACAEQQQAVERFYGAVAALVGAHPQEIAYTENATRAWDMAFHSVGLSRGDRVLTTTSEYASNAIAFHQVAAGRGVSVQVVPDGEDGHMCLESLERELARGGVRLVAVNHVPTHNGLVNPAARIGGLCRDFGALFLLDACQSVGQLQVDVGDIGCDMLSAAGRKFLRGPRGTGFLYVRRESMDTRLGEPPFLDLHSASWVAPERYRVRADARRFETWERNVAGQIGLAVAADYALGLGMDAIQERVGDLAARLRGELARLRGVRVLDRGAHQCGIVTFTVEGTDSGRVKEALGAQGINVSVTHGPHQQWDAGAVEAAVRASVHYYNTVEEIEVLLGALERL